ELSPFARRAAAQFCCQHRRGVRVMSMARGRDHTGTNRVLLLAVLLSSHLSECLHWLSCGAGACCSWPQSSLTSVSFVPRQDGGPPRSHCSNHRRRQHWRNRDSVHGELFGAVRLRTIPRPSERREEGRRCLSSSNIIQPVRRRSASRNRYTTP